MPYQFQTTGLDPHDFVQSLIRDMGFQNEPPARLTGLREDLINQMTTVILNTVSLYVEPEILERLAAEYQNEKDVVNFIKELMRYSPRTHLMVLHALDEFYDQTLDAFNTLCK